MLKTCIFRQKLFVESKHKNILFHSYVYEILQDLQETIRMFLSENDKHKFAVKAAKGTEQ